MIKRTSIILGLFLITVLVKSQSCSVCNFNSSQNDTSNYTVQVGEVLCIDSLSTFLGSVTLNGGTICNAGFLNPKQLVLNSGSILNSGNITLNTSLMISSGLSITISESSVINVAGTLTISGGSITNNGFINVSDVIQNNAGTITNQNVINCLHLIGNPIATGIVNTN